VHFVIIVPVGFGLGWLQLAEMPLWSIPIQRILIFHTHYLFNGDKDFVIFFHP
jgi:hypothetical protein